ncbi:MAG: hypothetical protein H0W71_09050 [Sphingomonas sp.]|nr:hypothetical protein [Sphingomonas sp.]
MTPAGPVNLVEAVPAVDDGDTLVGALRTKLGETRESIGATATYLAAFNDLDGDGTKEGLLYLIDPASCGSGGCSLYVFQGNGKGGWTISDTIGPAQLPVFKLDHKTDKWADLGVSVSGGGIPAALMAVPHGARGYAPNPTVDPAKPTEAAGALLLIADDKAKARAVRKG